MSQNDEDPIETWKKMTSRDHLLEWPLYMYVLGYLAEQYNVPKYGWQDNQLRYHYTDTNGLLGIITTNRIWATDIRFLNDPSEGQYLPQTLLKTMRDWLNPLNSDHLAVVERIELELQRKEDPSNTLSVSFCKNGDLLSQWRGYGSFGAGYAIGFRFGMGVPHPQIALYHDVFYGDFPYHEVAADLVDIYATAASKHGNHGIDLCSEAASVIKTIAYSCKHPSYSEEQESRMIAAYQKDSKPSFHHEVPIQFRPGGSNVIPYAPMALNLMRSGGAAPLLPIERIVVGPGVDFERNRLSVSQLLEEHDYKDVEVVRSELPFRP
jgi:hypothetical protein